MFRQISGAQLRLSGMPGRDSPLPAGQKDPRPVGDGASFKRRMEKLMKN